MKYFEKVPAKVMLEDGAVFEGWSAGKIGTTTGEVCFNTGMTGYQEIFTDPSYYGQVITMTNVHIGNYGTKNSDSESESVKIKGLITRNYTNLFSRPMADDEIQQYLLDEKIVGITGVDTRALVKHVRDKGAMNCIISSENIENSHLQKELAKVPSMAGLELSSLVTTKEPYFVGNEESSVKIAVLDLGVKKSILENLASRGCYLKVFPANSKFSKIMEWTPDGFFASNGPGDPAVMDYAVETVEDMLNTEKPFFGICLGHQIFARSQGVSTYKMHNGHRGINHPVINLATGKCEVTSQNHGFSISKEDVELNNDLEITHMNLNDDTVEGIKHKTLPAFSVQYHPEAAPGPNDSKYLFDQFLKQIKK
ncbi:MAG: glutamine-hydrolyzing carbamoyl-phosphate synthase small subunit [Bacteroidia bacterium]